MQIENVSFPTKENLLNILPDFIAGWLKERQALTKRTDLKMIEEFLSLAQYAYCLAQHDYLFYPFSFEKSESPDFIVNQKIGVEIARVSEENVEEQIARNNKLGQPTFLPLDGEGYLNYQREQEAFDAMLRQVKSKSEKIPEYRKKHPQLTQLDLLLFASGALILPDDFSIILEHNDSLWKQRFNESGFQNIGFIVNSTAVFYFDGKGKYEVFYPPKSLFPLSILAQST